MCVKGEGREGARGVGGWGGMWLAALLGVFVDIIYRTWVLSTDLFIFFHCVCVPCEVINTSA